ncbi:SRPBCC family protein [Actinopolymorpha pittospori]
MDSASIGEASRKRAERNPVTQRLYAYLSSKLQRRLRKLSGKLGDVMRSLAGVVSGDEGAGGMLGRTIKELLGGSSLGGALVKAGLKTVADKVMAFFKGLGGKGSAGKPMNLVEDLDMPVPLRLAYNHWTRLEDFPQWSKATQRVDLDRKDPTKSNWNAKVAFSRRSWTATVTEQIPDDRIAWQSKGQTVVNGVVSFHPLDDNLTKILYVLEYVPHGLFERTANLWRAQGRRARLDIKLFRRYVTTRADPEEEGWRGEIREGKVVRDHGSVLKEEEHEHEESY